MNIFTYNPFGEFALVNLTNSGVKFYYNKIDDLYQHDINVMISKDIPNIFVKTSSSKIRFGGPDGKMCELFCKKLRVNCRFEILEPDRMSKLNLTISDVVFNPSPILDSGSGESIMKMYSYPVHFDAVVIIVKASKRYSKLMQMTFYSEFGNSRQDMAIILASVILMLFIVRFRTLNFYTFVDTCRDVLSITIKLDIRRLFNLKLSEILVILPTTFFGFVIVNTVISILTTFYTTTTHYRPDINSLSDIDQLSCKIAVNNEHSMKILSEFNEFNWSTRFVYLNQQEITHQLFKFDTTTCFIDSFRRADVLMRYQKYRRRILHVVKLNLGPRLYGYMMHSMSPHKHRFNELILNAMSSGLYSKWSSDIYFELYEEGILKNFVTYSAIDHIPSSLQLFYIFWPLNILVYGFLISSMILCGEFVIKRFRH